MNDIRINELFNVLTMKYITLILVFSIFISTMAFSKKVGDKGFVDAQYECIWSVNFIDDTIKSIPGIEDRFILLIGENLSYQSGYRSQQHDSVWSYLKSWDDFGLYIEKQRETLRNSNTRENGVLRNNSFGDVKLYKDYKNKKIKVVDHISIHFFFYEETLLPQNWLIQEDTTTILDYFCQKAICDYRGRSYEAWFTSEIPISEGPWKFWGLPGLIIKMYDTKHHYDFDLIEFKKIDRKIDARVLTNNKLPQNNNRMIKLTKIERKKYLNLKFGIQGNLIMNIDNAKVGLSSSYDQALISHDDIERDYK